MTKPANKPVGPPPSQKPEDSPLGSLQRTLTLLDLLRQAQDAQDLEWQRRLQEQRPVVAPLPRPGMPGGPTVQPGIPVPYFPGAGQTADAAQPTGQPRPGMPGGPAVRPMGMDQLLAMLRHGGSYM